MFITCFLLVYTYKCKKHASQHKFITSYNTHINGTVYISYLVTYIYMCVIHNTYIAIADSIHLSHLERQNHLKPYIRTLPASSACNTSPSRGSQASVRQFASELHVISVLSHPLGRTLTMAVRGFLSTNWRTAASSSGFSVTPLLASH